MEYILIEEIIKRSVAENWDTAKLEWTFEFAYKVKDPKRCLCNHFPIKNICVIKNLKNNTSTEVGNCCVYKFMGIDIGNKIFSSINSLSKDLLKSLSSEVVEYLFEKKVINDFEYNFYNDISKKRILTPKQQEIKLRINEKFINFTSFDTNSHFHKIAQVLNWAKEKEGFDLSFIESLETNCKKNGKLSDKQVQALENIITRWNIAIQ
ncbi:MAG: hypothetical protein RLZ33_76 [Bacteroidota bacterium]|jgi:hypothetical protein